MEDLKVAVWHNLPSGGGKRALYDHVRGLIARGHEVEAWCPPTADREFLPLSGLIREHVIDLAPLEYRSSDRWQVTLWAERRLAAMDDHCRECAAKIQQGGFDVLFANSCQFFATSPIARYAGLPSVLYLQEPCRELYEALPQFKWAAPPAFNAPQPPHYNWMNAFVDWRTIRNMRVQARAEVDNARSFTRVLANSMFSRESILRAYGLDADVCYLGIDAGHFVNMNLPRENFIVGVGAFHSGKNIQMCIQAVAELPMPRPKLVWIGNASDSNYLMELRILAESLRVEFEPKIRITDAELVDNLNRAVAMVYAPRLEPFGFAPLEANACGLPVVAVGEGGVRETLVNQVNGFLVENDPAAIANAIGCLLADPTLRHKLGTNARREVETKWGLEAAIDRLERRLMRYAQSQ